MNKLVSIAVLDDYQQVALTMSDWTVVKQYAEVTVFSEHISDETILINQLKQYSVICVMRERTPMTRKLLSSLPNLKLIVSTGSRNASIDVKAAEELGVEIKHTGYLETGAPELTWALLMSLARHIPGENTSLKSGNWQKTIGTDLYGKTIGIVGLGRIGTKIAGYAKAFGMNVIAWSQNLTEERAIAAGARLTSKEELFRESDFVSIHLILSQRTQGLINEHELSLMKPTAYLVNTSRGPIINENALLHCLQQKGIAGAALDVFDEEPLPGDHLLRKLDNVLATPHIGYVTENTYRLFYEDTVKIIQQWLKIESGEKK